jgi:hypothetical protein
VGQTTKEMRQRHYGDGLKIKRKADGLGDHFFDHATEMGLDLSKSCKMDILMENFQLAIMGSVQPGQPWTQSRLDKLEADLQHRFQCLQKNGDIGLQDETRRRKHGQ